jgi:GalNAc5-diNAcBac-PP-undecaprenol beta-1,3-glucosyltransferase
MAHQRGPQRALAAAPVDVRATVLVPTHTHGETLRHSVATALGQTVRDLEVFIVGDGVPDVTREIARELTAADPRVRFFDFPKGPSRGELHRHRVLGEANGEIVCYLFDDDLWLPEHVEVAAELLHDADFAFTMPVIVAPDGSHRAWFVDLRSPTHRRLFTNPLSDTPSSPTCAAHTMALYRRLPFGWRTTPRGSAPDKYMWAQCLADPRTIALSAARPTALIFPDPPRRGWTADARVAELRDWSGRLQDRAWRQEFDRSGIAHRAQRPGARRRILWWSYAQLLRVPGAGTYAARFGKRILARARRS